MVLSSATCSSLLRSGLSGVSRDHPRYALRSARGLGWIPARLASSIAAARHLSCLRVISAKPGGTLPAWAHLALGQLKLPLNFWASFKQPPFPGPCPTNTSHHSTATSASQSRCDPYSAWRSLPAHPAHLPTLGKMLQAESQTISCGAHSACPPSSKDDGPHCLLFITPKQWSPTLPSFTAQWQLPLVYRGQKQQWLIPSENNSDAVINVATD